LSVLHVEVPQTLSSAMFINTMIVNLKNYKQHHIGFQFFMRNMIHVHIA